MRSFCAFLFLCLIPVQAAITPDASLNGQYTFAVPERGATQATLQTGSLGNKTVLAVAKGKGMPPAVYTFLPEQSNTLGFAIFHTMTLYVMQYDPDTFVLAMGDGVLGRKVWTKVGYINVYSKDPEKAKTLLPKASAWAIEQSQLIMNQNVGKMTHAAGTYHLAVPMKHMGKARPTYEIEFITEAPKALHVTTIPDKAAEVYEILPKESAICGVDVYRNASSHYIFDEGDGVLLYTFANANGLGKTDWTKSSRYNVFSNNQAYIRQLLTSKEKQNTIDTLMAGYFKSVKETFIKEAQEMATADTANRKLPARGKKDATLDKEALAAAQRWAKAWAWKEELKAVYMTSHD